MIIELFEDRILISIVRERPKDTTTDGGIIVPASENIESELKDEHEKGEVIIIGDDCNRYKVNDMVVFDRVAGRNIRLEGKSYVIMREGDISGRLPKPNT